MKEQILQPVADVWRRHCAALGDALAETIDGLDNLVRLDEFHRHGRDPDRLESALGPLAAASLDVGALSQALGKSTRSRAMAPERLARVQELIPKLRQLKEAWSDVSLDHALVELGTSPEDALAQAEAHFNQLGQVFRAVRIAQLEIRSKYDAQTHDAAFANFDWRQLGPGELRTSPPFLVIARLDRGDGGQLRNVMALLETGMPIKVLALRTSVRDVVSGAGGTTVPSKMTIETLPLAMRGVYLLQTHWAAAGFEAQLAQALTGPRPAVISVFCPRKDEAEQAFQTRAARAVRARAVPMCVYDPDRNDRFVMCFDLSANPSTDALWATDKLTGRDSLGEPIEVDEPFTLAHFAASEPDLASEFSEPPEHTDALVPLSDFLRLSRHQQMGKLPFVWLAAQDGTVVRKVVSRTMASRCAERLHLWQTLQEISGIDNPYVNATRATLQKELGAERDAQLASLRQSLEKDAAGRERAAVASAVRKLVARLTGIEPQN